MAGKRERGASDLEAKLSASVQQRRLSLKRGKGGEGEGYGVMGNG